MGETGRRGSEMRNMRESAGEFKVGSKERMEEKYITWESTKLAGLK